MTKTDHSAITVVTANALPESWMERFPWYKPMMALETSPKESGRNMKLVNGLLLSRYSFSIAIFPDWHKSQSKRGGQIQSGYPEDNPDLGNWWHRSLRLLLLSHCDGNFNKDQCLDKKDPTPPKLYFIPWAICDLNNWIYSRVSDVDNTAGIADGLSAKLVETFATNAETVICGDAMQVIMLSDYLIL